MKNTTYKNKISVTLLLVVTSSAFMFHFLWEIWQAPFYEGLIDTFHWDAVVLCSRASLGDACISIFSYLLIAWVAKDHLWLYQSRSIWILSYLGIGLVITVMLEYFSINVFDRWQYSEKMPRIWGLGTGVVPITQWLLVPLISLWVAKVFYLGLSMKQLESLRS